MEANTEFQTPYEYEATVAGSILIDPESYARVSRLLSSADFIYDVPAKVFDAAARLTAEFIPIDPVMIMDRSGVQMQHLQRCIDWAGGTAVNDMEYAKLVKECSIRRRLQKIGDQLAQSGGDTGALLSMLRRELERIEAGKVLSDLISSRELLNELYTRRQMVDEGNIPMVPTGFPQLDDCLGGGLIDGGLIILGASPGTGKTSLAINIADHVDGPVLFVSCEMTPGQIMVRRMASKSGVSSKTLTSGRMDETDYERIAGQTEFFTRSRLMLSRNAAPTISEISAMAASIHGLKLIVVDYLGLLKCEEARGSKYEEISIISRSLKTLAVNLQVPVLCLSQLNRDASRAKAKPTLASLRDSGQIEADADVVLLLYQEGEQEESGNGPTRVICEVAKNRHGEAKKQIAFDAYMHTCRFVELGGPLPKWKGAKK